MHRFLFLILAKVVIGDNCVCLPFWLCRNGTFTKDDFDPSTNCTDYFDVCCKITCGQRNADNLPFDNTIRILGTDNNAAFAEFPWMLAILHDNKYRCGASLIHPQAAITAAHCVQERLTYTIRAGEWDWRGIQEPLPHEDRHVQKTIIHPEFNRQSLANDVALMILDIPFSVTDHIGVACLPPQDSSPTPESECVVSGWGKASSDAPEAYQPILKKASLPIVWQYQCTKVLQRAQLGPLFQLHKSFICAGGGKHKDACRGDGGSPLMCLLEGEAERYEQFGIVSWGLTCGRTDAPGVYASVARFVDWIDRQMEKNGLDYRVYKYRQNRLRKYRRWPVY